MMTRTEAAAQPTAWTVAIDGDASRFPLYASQARAERARGRFAAAWPAHRYTVEAAAPTAGDRVRR